MGTTAAAGAIKPGRGRREAHAHGAGSAMSHGNGWGPPLGAYQLRCEGRGAVAECRSWPNSGLFSSRGQLWCVCQQISAHLCLEHTSGAMCLV